MKRAVEYTSWPLPESLTRKIVNYLDVYRLIIALILGIAHFGSLTAVPAVGSRPFFASVVLAVYFFSGLLYLFKARGSSTDVFRLASFSLSTDVIFLGLLVVFTSGIENGLGILLVFTSGAAAIVLPLRNALLLASIACLAMIGTAGWDFVTGSGPARDLIQAGLFGITTLVTAILANQLAYWARDYRLIAEKRKTALTELEQANELIIRRMRTGVIAVDEANQIRVMNESAWFLMEEAAPGERRDHLRNRPRDDEKRPEHRPPGNGPIQAEGQAEPDGYVERHVRDRSRNRTGYGATR